MIRILASNDAGFRWSLSRLTFKLAMTQVLGVVYHDSNFASNNAGFRWSPSRFVF
jgi:hypothetical protein